MRDRDSGFILSSPLGRIEIGIEEGSLVTLRYLGVPDRLATRGWQGRVSATTSSAPAREIAYQLNCYFSDPRWRFDLPVVVYGTSFQQRVWRALERIPSGKVMTYGEIARRLDSGARAVGGACASNPLPIVIPCHRAVAAGGVGGYCGNLQGRMLRAKEWLLRHELG